MFQSLGYDIIAQQHYQKSANVQFFSISDFKIGNKIFIKAQFFRTIWPSKNSLKSISDPIKSFSNLVHCYSLSAFQSLCALYI